jgi:regulator of protease activity HflC (stomatin/prohibitin superfamily)
MELISILGIMLLVLGLVCVFLGIKIVPQSEVYVIERFGRFEKVLNPGLNLIVPGLQYVAHRVSVLERQLPSSTISIITKDNVQVNLKISVFYRVTDAPLTVYRIKDVDGAVGATTAAIIRAACGELDFDDVQSKREYLNAKIQSELAEATKIWGVDITRTEVLDVSVDEVIQKQMQQQMAADRDRRATILRAEGVRQSDQLSADAEYYTAQKQAEATRVRADADAYATRVMAQAIADNGQAAIDFTIMKAKISALQALGASSNSKLLILPTEVTKILGGLEVVSEILGNSTTGRPQAPPPVPQDDPDRFKSDGGPDQ